MAVKDWSTTASTNATADAASGINWAEGQAPSSVNDSARALMAVIKGDFANSLAANGYQKLPNGAIIQWGTASGGDQTITFPIAFPTACVFVSGTIVSTASSTTLAALWSSAITTTGFGALPRIAVSGGSVSATGAAFRWFSIGY